MSKVRASLVAVLLVISAFAVPASAESIEFWLFPGEPYESSLRALAASFTEETGIGVEIVLVPYAEHQQKLTVAAAGGSPPDVMEFERSAIKEFVGAYNVLEPLDRLLADFDRSSLLPGPLEEATFGGEWYGMPERTDVRGLYWNQSLAAAAGLDAENGPRTWEELDLFARRLTRTDGSSIVQLGFAPWYANWTVAGWIWTFGGEVYDAERNAPTVATPVAADALTWIAGYQNWLGPEGRTFASKFGGTDGAFNNGFLAMIPESTSFIGRLATNAPGLSYMTGEVPHPPGGANGTWAGGPALVIPRGARNPQGAARFLAYVARPESQLRRYADATAIPANLEALFDAIDETEHVPTARLFAQLPVAHGRPPLWTRIIAALTQAQNKVLDGTSAPPAALEEAQRTLEAEFERVFGAR